jgi:hypothetical protein
LAAALLDIAKAPIALILELETLVGVDERLLAGNRDDR